MTRRSTAQKAALTPRRRRGAAIQIVGGGLLLLVLPVVLGSSSAAAQGFQALAPVGWTMLVGGLVLLWSLRDKSPATMVVKPASSWVSPGSQIVVDSPRPVRRTKADIDIDLGTAGFGDRSPPWSLARPQPAERPSGWSKELVETMQWRRFEAVVEALFQQAGFETGLQPHLGNDGVDIWLYSRSQTGGPVSVVQCKQWHGESVGPDRLRALRLIMNAHEVERGQFATTASFTPEAVAFARRNGIHLLDAEGILALIAKRSPSQQQALLSLAVD